MSGSSSLYILDIASWKAFSTVNEKKDNYVSNGEESEVGTRCEECYSITTLFTVMCSFIYLTPLVSV